MTALSVGWLLLAQATAPQEATPPPTTPQPSAQVTPSAPTVPQGRAEASQVSVGLYFSSAPPAQQPYMVRLGRQNLDIAAGSRAYVSSDAYVLPVDVEVLSVQPDAVVESARFAEDLDADSLDLVELVMGLEERFDVAVTLVQGRLNDAKFRSEIAGRQRQHTIGYLLGARSIFGPELVGVIGRKRSNDRPRGVGPKQDVRVLHQGRAGARVPKRGLYGSLFVGRGHTSSFTPLRQPPLESSQLRRTSNNCGE